MASGSSSFDAIVVGGGPAGALCGLRLARAGWRVALIEKGARNRAKACGHCLNPRARRYLDQAGVWDPVETLAVGRTKRVRVHHETLGQVTADHPDPEPEALVVDRRILDQCLLDMARDGGACVEQPAIVTAIRSREPWSEIDVQRRSGLVTWRALYAPPVMLHLFALAASE